EMGWRTTARNLNLNRDYMKADAPETRAFLRLWNRWLPDFFVDNHVTDGVDYQNDTTYAMETGPNAFPALAEWQRNVLAPYLEEAVTRSGHIISPYLSLVDPTDPARGLYQEESQPRYSTGYMVLQNRPGMLVEMHMLKDYRTRVTGNYELLRALLEVVNRDAELLVRATREADAATIAAGRRHDPEARYPLRIAASPTTEPFLFRGYRFERSLSEVSGAVRVEYTRQPMELTVPARRSFAVAQSVAPPAAYIIPPQWQDVADVLSAHGLRILRTSRHWTSEVETYRCASPQWLPRPYEGRQVLFTPAAGEQNSSSVPPLECVPVRESLYFPAGSAVIPLDQRAAQVAIHFLEPGAPDSAVAWGFFNAIFERKEYAEGYVLEKLAREMMERDPKLKQEFEEKVAGDKAFAASPQARLDFFYRRSPWWDQRLGLYPVGRLTSLDGVPLSR
ncbi:MAG: M14 family metallopeptidase, partial [Terriglobales bacterium]